MERRVIVHGRPRRAVGAVRSLPAPARVDPADPFVALMGAWFDATLPPARWAVVAGSGADAEAALDAAAAAKELLVVRTGIADADARLVDLAPVLGRLLDDMTPSQRRLAMLLLVDGRRQADAAEILGISRASVSVAHGRARIHEVGLLLRATRASWAAGLAAWPSPDGPSLTGSATVPR